MDITDDDMLKLLFSTFRLGYHFAKTGKVNVQVDAADEEVTLEGFTSFLQQRGFKILTGKEYGEN